MIKISHESPISMLEYSRMYNDYDYALVHLFEKYPAYYRFFEDSVKAGRHVLLDNSIFELGEAFDMSEFHKWILKLQPTEYIIPDALDNADDTIRNLQRWFEYYYHRIDSTVSQPMAVIQGETLEDIMRCYWTIRSYGIRRIAVSFNYQYYEKQYPNLSKENAWMKGRLELMKILLDQPQDVEFHLLGCSLPQEFVFYNEMMANKRSQITSIDTSCPIVHGLKEIIIDPEYGLKIKESTKLVDLIEATPTERQREIIDLNITNFSYLVND